MAEDLYLVTERELQSATVNAAGELEFTRENGQKINAGVVVGPAATNADVASFVNMDGPTKAALNATIGEKVTTTLAPIAGQAVEDAAAGLDLVLKSETSAISTPGKIPVRDATGSFAIPAASETYHPVRKDSFDLELGRINMPTRPLVSGSVDLDLDTVTTAGLYEQSASAKASAALHYPVASAGFLRVTASSNGRVWQEYTTFGFGALGNRTYKRGLYSGTWTAWQELVRADQVPDAASLPTTYAPFGVVSREQREDEIRRGKGGVIGTAGKGVISFREDHKTDQWLSTVWPLLVERNLPASFGVVSGSIGNPSATYEPTASTWADVHAMFKQGAEIWDHSLTHSNPTGSQKLSDVLAGSRALIEAQGFRVMGFQQPGAPATYGAAHTSIDAMQDEAGRLIQATYGLFESSLLGTNRRVLPTNGARGHDHVTIDALALSSIKGLVDEAAARKIGIQLMLHADVVGQPGKITLADLTAALDYIAQARDDGRIEVLTASGLAFADPNVDRRFDWIATPTFDGLSTATRGYGWSEATAGAWTIEDGNLLTIPASKTLVYSTGQLRNLGLDGNVFMLDTEVRAPDTDATVHLRVTELGGAAQVIRDVQVPIAAGSGFTRIRIPAGIPKGIVSGAVWVGRSAGGRVQFKNVHLYST